MFTMGTWCSVRVEQSGPVGASYLPLGYIPRLQNLRLVHGSRLETHCEFASPGR